MTAFLKSFFTVIIFSFFILIGCGGDKKDQPQDMNDKESTSSEEDTKSDEQKMSELMGGDLFEN